MASEPSYPQESEPGARQFERLVELHYEPLYRFAMSLTRSESEASDLVQETFVTWATKGHQLKDASRAKSWLFTTLHRRHLETQRRITRFPHVDLAEAATELPEVDPELVNRLDGQTILTILGKVDPQFRAAVALFYLEDQTYPEIAEILQVPVGTVKSRISRGVAQLKALVLTGGATPKGART